ncbi:MAG: hypothetical protein ACKOJF_11850, partial [Planctomycetaceae bacterium]
MADRRDELLRPAGLPRRAGGVAGGVRCPEFPGQRDAVGQMAPGREGAWHPGRGPAALDLAAIAPSETFPGETDPVRIGPEEIG